MDFVKDPGATLDYTIDWTQYLGSDTIETAEWAESVPSGLTNEDEANTTTTTTIRVSGGAAGTQYLLKCTVTLTSEQADVRRIKIIVQEL